MKLNLFFLLVISFVSVAQRKDKTISYIDETRLKFEVTYLDNNPRETAKSWKVPFLTSDRNKLSTVKVISIFGAPRESFLKGHIHTAIDIIPVKLDSYNYVFPVACGIVCSIHLGHPYKTIVIKHRLPDSTIVYSSYKHLRDIYVPNGMEVKQDTKLGRLYTRDEAKKLGGSYDHLHLEIRKSFYDYGCASWLTMTKAELNKYFYNPLDFLKKHVGEVAKIN